MKKIIVLLLTISWFGLAAQPKTNHYLKITLDTKLMSSLDYSLGGGNGVPSSCQKVYAHLGLCTCDLDWNGATFLRDCALQDSNLYFCLSQILPYRSNVWQHVVGNWGENPQDDGTGLMTNLGDGVYSIEFIIEDYFSNPALVNTTTFIDPNDPHPVVQSTVWNPTDGGAPHTIGMVFRNEDGTLTGRDDLGKDLFIIDLTSNPQVIQGSDPGTPFSAITFVTNTTSVNSIADNSVHYLSIYPNPVKDVTKIIYTATGRVNQVSIKIFDMMGKEITNVYDGIKPTGSFSVNWNGKDIAGNKLSPGMYFCVLQINGKLQERKQLIIE
ncbi:MAG: T9SS type A sorting domain-containing protein [Bacteroidia bacterium]|nr:T9SS type A sorting domain-containing protein [Bacteroidia bacterium]